MPRPSPTLRHRRADPHHQPQGPQVVIEEAGDWDDYDPEPRNPGTCHRDAGSCPLSRDDI